MLAVLVGQVVALLRPDAPALGAVLLVTALLIAALAVVVAARTSSSAPPEPMHGFAALRPLLGASAPDAAGHPMARAPGAGR